MEKPTAISQHTAEKLYSLRRDAVHLQLFDGLREYYHFSAASERAAVVSAACSYDLLWLLEAASFAEGPPYVRVRWMGPKSHMIGSFVPSLAEPSTRGQFHG